MKVPEHSHPPRAGHGAASLPDLATSIPSSTPASRPALVAGAFGKLDVKRRSRLLGRLLGSVGPLALAVIGGGAFVKYLPHARWPIVPVSLEDAARATSYQVYELVRYVEQSNPHLIEGVLTALVQDGVAVTALGASLAATAIKHLSHRSGLAPASPRPGRKL